MASTDVRGLGLLPLEILESISDLLDLDDLRSVRLVLRDFGVLCSKRIFTNKTLEWTSRRQLLEFVQLTEPKRPGCWLQRLTIYGVVRANDPSAYALLAEAFSNLRRNSASGILQRISLSVKGLVIRRGSDSTLTYPEVGSLVSCEQVKDCGQIWATAGQSFETLTRALEISGLPVKEVDIFGDVPRCSLACDYIGPVLNSVDLSISFQAVTRLSLNISHGAKWMIMEKEPRHEPVPTPEDGKKRVNDICRIIQLCPQLDSLDLRWCSLTGWNVAMEEREPHRERWREEQHFLNQVVYVEQLSQLKECRLRGMYTDGPTLLALIEKMKQLRRLTLEELYLETGRFEHAFDHLTNLRHMEYLHLSHLYESNEAQRQVSGMICFDSLGDDHVRDGPSCLNELTRTGMELRQAIGYTFKNGLALAGLSLEYLFRTGLKYGPPRDWGGPGRPQLIA